MPGIRDGFQMFPQNDIRTWPRRKVGLDIGDRLLSNIRNHSKLI
jgi:hypothetical protein